MKIFISTTFTIALTALSSYSIAANANLNTEETKVVNANTLPFDSNLAKFENYLGGWTSTFGGSADKPPVTDVTLFEKVLKGKALRTTHSINNGAYGGESMVYWNNKSQKLEFYYFTTADFFTSGWMEFISENTFVAYENVSGESAMSSGISQVKSTSKLEKDTMTVSTSYLKNGVWTEPESRVYRRTTKNVVFK